MPLCGESWELLDRSRCAKIRTEERRNSLLIVIEGVDGTGKTDLAHRLRQRVGYERSRILHAGRPTRPAVEEYETPLRDYEPGVEYTYVLDRWHVGEYIWPHVFGREPIDLASARHVELFMLSRGAYYVHAWREPDALRKLFAVQAKQGEEQPPEMIENLEQIIERFEHAFGGLGVTYSQWNFDIDDSDAHVGEIVARSSSPLAYEASQPFLETREWIGSPRPRALLVGERFGPKQDLEHAHVPFVPYPATAGRYLLECLPSRGGWKEYALVNAYRGWSDETHDLGRLQALLGDPVLVALGNEASAVLRDQDLPHEKIPHPQWWRRFNHHDRLGYTRAIQHAVWSQEEHE